MAGDPTEGAPLVMGRKAGMEEGTGAAALPRIDCIPIESEHRFMATLHRVGTDEDLILVKGTPERILDLCGRQAGQQGKGPLDADY